MSFQVPLLPAPEWIPPHCWEDKLSHLTQIRWLGAWKLTIDRLTGEKKTGFIHTGVSVLEWNTPPPRAGYEGVYTNLMGVQVSKGSCGETKELLGEQMRGMTVLKMFVDVLTLCEWERGVMAASHLEGCAFSQLHGRSCRTSCFSNVFSPWVCAGLLGPTETLFSIWPEGSFFKGRMAHVTKLTMGIYSRLMELG